MRILHVIPSLDPASGGPPGVVAGLAAAQAGLGHEVSIAAHADPARTAAVDALLSHLPCIERVKRVSLPMGGRLSISAESSRMLDQAVDSAQVVHIHALWEPILRSAAGLARRCGIPYLIAPHGMLYPWSLSRKWLKKRLVLALTGRRMLNRAALLHMLNVDEQRAIEPLGLRAPTVVLPNGVFPEELALPPTATFYEQQPALRRRPYILFLSRLHPGKGLDLLAEAFAQVARQDAEVQLVVAGPDAGARQPFERRIGELALSGRVHLVGPLYGAAKLAALGDALCFCLPSHHETFSMAITEALACGLPAVITANCHFPEVAEADAGLVVGPDAAELAGALQRVVGDAALRERLGRSARQLIAERFTWPRIAAAAVEAYGRAIAARGPEAAA